MLTGSIPVRGAKRGSEVRVTKRFPSPQARVRLLPGPLHGDVVQRENSRLAVCEREFDSRHLHPSLAGRRKQSWHAVSPKGCDTASHIRVLGIGATGQALGCRPALQASRAGFDSQLLHNLASLARRSSSRLVCDRREFDSRERLHASIVQGEREAFQASKPGSIPGARSKRRSGRPVRHVLAKHV